MDIERKGIVYLVGAGPGNAGLITVRGAECLKRADVVVYDSLANAELLHYAPTQAKLIYAGKRAAHHTMSQDEINSVLLDKAAAGLTVVRLKGGDPFVFGRGGEEAQWLTEHGIAWEVVPGITSAIAAPAYAGIPVTHRNIAGLLHIVTGHESQDGTGANVDWKALAKCGGTIVLLMGVKNLPQITQQLMENGMAADTPVGVIHWGTRAGQRTVVSHLGSVVEDVENAGLKAPSIIVVGEVVSLRSTLAWAEKRPLFGLRVAVTRPEDENDELAGRLENLGAEVVRVPTMRLVPISVDAAARDLLTRLSSGKFEWLGFTSRNGVKQFVRMLLESGKDFRSLAGVQIAVIGERTDAALRNYGISADRIVEESSQEGMAAALIELNAQSVLIARAKIARPVLEDSLMEAGVDVSVLPVYDMVPDQAGIQRLQELLEVLNIDVVCFTSGRSFGVLADSLSEGGMDALKNCAIAVMGTVTKKALEDRSMVVQAIAERTDMDSLVAALVQWRRNSRTSALEE